MAKTVFTGDQVRDGTIKADDIDSNYPGQISITTLGTVTTGNWQASTIGADKGGTGRSTMTQDALLLGNSASQVGLTTGFIVREATTTTINATPVILMIYSAPANKTTFLEARVVARRTGGTAGTAEDGAAYLLRGVYKNAGSLAELIGAVQTDFTEESQAGWTATLTISNSDIRVSVTGAADNNISWYGILFISSIAS